MFETVEIGHKIRKSVFKRREPQLRQRLLALQYRLLEKKEFPVLVLVNGLDGAGKSETFNLFNEWMDPRHIRTVAFGKPTEWDLERPEMWRYWQTLPAKGHIGILVGAWYQEPLDARVYRGEKRAEFEQRLERIRHFERMLVAEGAMILKLWFHLSEAAQKQRLEDLSSSRKTAWRVTKEEWRQFDHYRKYVRTAEEMIGGTSTGEAPWEIVDGSDHEYRSLTAGALLEETLAARLTGKRAAPAPQPPASMPPLDKRTLLASYDYTRALDHDAYKKKLVKFQGRLNRMMRGERMRERPLVMVFEGMDAAGKGSTIRRVTQALDARFYRVIPIAAPSDEERAQPYLWRFWRQVPGRGRTAIFDRSWYGRVLVERVEGFAAEPDWMRAYHEINEFEEQLAEAGAIVVKFWMAITPQEQLRRFHEREKTSYKRYKITPEDWRNRKKWPQYELAVNDMVERTSTEHAPWNIVASDDKAWSRIEVLKTLVHALEGRL
ncbi:MAG: polyphosphate:AMP phosphotransferase [Usitatibacter sp.]